MFLAGAACIEAKKEYINELNVFPVPEGDTGTNMTLTIMAAVKEVNSLNNPSIEELSKAISGGSLRGARGNSGVILSQLFRGFTKEIRNYDELNVAVITNGLKGCRNRIQGCYEAKGRNYLDCCQRCCRKAAELALKTDDLVYFCRSNCSYGRCFSGPLICYRYLKPKL